MYSFKDIDETILNEFRKKQEEFYNRIASFADKYYPWGRANRNHYRKIKEIARVLNLSKGDLILEVGVGTAIHAEWLLKNRQINYYGVDISVAMLREASKRLSYFGDKVKLQRENATNLSFESNKFDAVFCSGTLHHILEPIDMIKEMVRVVKCGGYIAVMEPNWLHPTNLCYALARSIDRNILKMRKRNLNYWCRTAGLEEVKVHNFIYTPPFPEFLFPIFDRVDDILPSIPIIKNTSIMLLCCGRKRRR